MLDLRVETFYPLLERKETRKMSRLEWILNKFQTAKLIFNGTKFSKLRHGKFIQIQNLLFSMENLWKWKLWKTFLHLKVNNIFFITWKLKWKKKFKFVIENMKYVKRRRETSYFDNLRRKLDAVLMLTILFT